MRHDCKIFFDSRCCSSHFPEFCFLTGSASRQSLSDFQHTPPPSASFPSFGLADQCERIGISEITRKSGHNAHEAKPTRLPLGDIARDLSFRAMNAALTQGSPFASRKEN